MTMGEKILNMRKARGWNQEELAERIGVTRQAVSRWESDSAKPDADKIVAICDLFGVSADYLLRDRYSGESSVVREEKPCNVLPAKAQFLTLRQWFACGLSVVGGLVMLLLKLVYVFKDTNYGFYSLNGYEYFGFSAFLLTEELSFIWYLAMMAFAGGLVVLFVLPIICKYKEKIRGNSGSD